MQISTSDLLINPNSNAKHSCLRITPGHKKIIALTHFGRSGTGLLHSLIDGHSSISTLPSIYFSEFFDPPNWQKIISGGWDNAIEKFMITYDVLFDANSSVPIQSRSAMLYNIGKKEGMADLGLERNKVFSIDRSLFKNQRSYSVNIQISLPSISFSLFILPTTLRSVTQPTKKFYFIIFITQALQH